MSGLRYTLSAAVLLILLLNYANSSKTKSSKRRQPPPTPAVTVTAHPGANLWSGEDLALECTVRTLEGAAPGPGSVGAAAVWYRSLLDPAGRRLLRSLGGTKEERERSQAKRLVVTERTAELISHGEILLLADQRFRISVREEEEDGGRVVYRLEIDGTRVEDSGDYECQLAGYVEDDEIYSMQTTMTTTAGITSSQKIEINVFEKSVSAWSKTTESSSVSSSAAFTAMVQNDDDNSNRRSMGNNVEASSKKSFQRKFVGNDQHEIGIVDKSEPSKHKDSRSVACGIVSAPMHFLLSFAFLYTLQYL